MQTEIVIRCEETPIELFKNDLESCLAQDTDVGLHLRTTPDGDRTPIDPTILVALVGAGGIALTSLIQGILRILTPTQTITLTGKSGRSIKIPANTPKEELPGLIDLVKKLDVEEIIVKLK